MKKIPYPCVIFCGGKSSRMQRDKSLLEVNKQSLALFQRQKLLELFNEVYISTKENKYNLNEKYLIYDENNELFSPMLALYSVLKKFKNTFVFILSVDMPDIGKNSILKLFKAIDDNKIILAKTSKHKHFLCGFYHSDLSEFCLDFLEKNQQKISNLCDIIKTKFIYFDNEKEFVNLNYYDEFLKWKNEKNKLNSTLHP